MLLYALFCQAERNTNSNDTFLLRALHRCPAKSAWTTPCIEAILSGDLLQAHADLSMNRWLDSFESFENVFLDILKSNQGSEGLVERDYVPFGVRLTGSCMGQQTPTYWATAVSAFGWERVKFLLSSWYMVVFWIYCKNNVYNSLMSQLLLSSAYPKSRTF